MSAADVTARARRTYSEEELGTPILGPSALGNDSRRFWHLTWTLAKTDFKLRFFDNALGYFWSLMRPLMLFGVLYLVFSVALDVGNDVEYFPVALLMGIVLYSFFNEATSQGLRSLLMREPLVRKVEFPRLAVPTASVLSATFSLGLNLIPVVVFALVAGVTPRWTWLLCPFLLVGLVLFAWGLALLLSCLFVRARDIEPIWDVVLQIMLYATPIFYPIELFVYINGGEHPELGRLIMCSPLAVVIQQLRDWFIDPGYLSAAEAIGLAWRLVIPGAIWAGVIVGGFFFFKRVAPRIAEDL
ncbi:MAG: ABC transporter permease [Solirubrobacterales bacterium]|nr:ABC transporter permease [Solirubrobacterales bacterium]